MKKYWKSFGLYAAIFVIIAMLIAVAGQKSERSSNVNYTYSDLLTALEKDQIKEIAETKMPDLNAANIEAAMRMIEGTARSMGVVVEE